MKIKPFTFLVTILLPVLCHGQQEDDFEHHGFFEHKSLTLGVATPYSFELNSLGVNLRMYHNVNENICFGPEVSYFKNGESEIVDFDFVMHYIFETPLVGIYPLLGANYTVETEKHLQETETLAKAGMVYGLGMHRNIKRITFFMEYSRVEWGITDQFITAGLMYNFN